jgi:glycosyltransferase involved in cell wall biosynthesis
MSEENFHFPKIMMQIIDDAAVGGAENHTRLITKEFTRRGYRILLVCPQGPYVKQFETLKETPGAHVEILSTSLISKDYMNPLAGFDFIHLIKAIRLLRVLIKEKQIQVIHSHKHPMDFLVALAARTFPSVKKITTIHSMDNKDKFWAWRRWRYHFIKKSLTQFDYVFTVSESVRINTIRYFSLPPHKVVTAMNGIDLSELKPDLSADEVRRRYKILPGHFVILSVGKVEYRKGQDILLRAISSIIRPGDLDRKISVLLVGNPDPPFQRKLSLLSKELKIEKNLIWISYEPNIANLLQTANLYIQPSRWDPLPRALIEAMGMGVCSIGSRVDGIPELIDHEKTGLLFKNESVEDLTYQIKKGLTNPALRESCAEEAVKRVKSRHTTSHMADTIEKYLFGGQLEDRS